MAYKYIEIEKTDKGVGVMTLNHPETLNALGVDMSREMKAAMSELAADDSVRVLLLKGAGRAFSAGGNVREMRASFEADPDKYMDDLTREVYSAVEAVEELAKPVVAQVHGFAYGAAMNLVMACDLAVAADDTVFCESFLKIGLIPGGHATLLLPACMGPKKAAELCLTAREVGAEEAVRLGIVNSAVPASELAGKAMSLAEKVASMPPIAINKTKQLLREAGRRPVAEQAKIERETQLEMARTQDYQEGINSFFEKRKPVFKGK